MDWFLYDNGLRHERVNSKGFDSGETNLSPVEFLVRYLASFLFLSAIDDFE